MLLKIMIVDDDEVVTRIHKKNVIKSGLSADPMCFKDGKYAFEYLTEHHEDGSKYLILLDINMPVMDGWMFLNSINHKPLSDCVNVIIVSSSSNKKDRDIASQYRQVIDYVEKPLTFNICVELRKRHEINN
jgi:CheY-like chemotaxis protein